MDVILRKGKSAKYPRPGPTDYFQTKKMLMGLSEKKKKLFSCTMEDKIYKKKEYNLAKAKREFILIDDKYKKSIPGPADYSPHVPNLS